MFSVEAASTSVVPPVAETDPIVPPVQVAVPCSCSVPAPSMIALEARVSFGMICVTPVGMRSVPPRTRNAPVPPTVAADAN
jgi:hypothetical protein